MATSKYSRDSKRPSPGSSSPVLWLLLVLWSLAIVYGSLWPWQDWREIGSAPWAFLGDRLPRYWTWFDLFSNVALYAPLGLLLALNAPWPSRSRLWLALVVGGLLSLFIETAQSYLPQRVPSLLDVLANTVGALLGGFAAAGLSRPWQKIRRLSRHWWHEQAQWPAVLVILWLATRSASLFSAIQASIATSAHWPAGTESVVTGFGMVTGFGLGVGAGWLLVESLLLSLLLAQLCRSAWLFWLCLGSMQCLLLGGLLLNLLHRPALHTGATGLLPMLIWMLILAGWAFWHRIISPRGAGLLGLGIASLWALRTLILVVVASLVAEAERSSLGPGLGPSPSAELGLGAWLLSLQDAWSIGLASWRLSLDPYWQAMLDLWLGQQQTTKEIFGRTPVLGRSLQHFEAVVLLVQELWRWMCLLWFAVVALEAKQARIRPRRRL